MAESKYYGIYQGVVTNIQDPEQRGRIKVKCPDVLGGETESAWCDPMIPVAYDNGGDFCIPALEETVWLMFIGGDANRPVWLGGWWQKSMTPLGTNYTMIDQVRIINYADCTITMQNGKININVGSGVCDLKIEHNTVTVDGSLVVKGKITAVDIEATGDTVLKETETTTLKSTNINASGYVKADGNVTANGDVKAQEISLTKHIHSGVVSGGSKTGEPVV